MFDLHVHTNLSIGENALEEMADFSKKLGLRGIGVVRYYVDRVDPLPSEVDGIEIINCVMVKAKTPQELNELALKIRDKAEILMVHGGDYDVNRAACENSLIDVLCHPELGRKDSGLDHIAVKAAAANKVAIEINFRAILESYKKRRIRILSSMAKNVKLCREYNADVITASGAVNKYGLRSGRELAAITNLLGLELGKAIESVSSLPEEMIKVNREKLSGKRWEGARVVE